jgi:integrase
MARTLASSNLESREARKKLKPRGRPYYRAVERQAHIGYRRNQPGVPGAWSVRNYIGEGRYDEAQLGTADDLHDADGKEVLTYWQAVDAARAYAAAPEPDQPERSGPYTVAHAGADYVEFLTHNRRTGYDVRKRMEAHALPALGDLPLEQLTADRLRKWHAGLVKQAPRLRTRPGEKQRHREVTGDDEAVRKRRVSANRCLSQLKAALNYAYNDDKVSSAEAWRKVKPFRGADAARVRYLTIAECKRLLNACEPAFRNLVRAALETGARYGELSRLKVSDYNADVGTVSIRVSKTATPRHVVLTPDGVSVFANICAGRAGDELLLTKADGSAWGKSHQRRPMSAACARAKITPALNFHGLRHCWASHAVMLGLPLLVVAKNLGHADTRMVEKHYGHLAPSYIADAIRQHAPRFGKVETNVRAINA